LVDDLQIDEEQVEDYIKEEVVEEEIPLEFVDDDQANLDDLLKPKDKKKKKRKKRSVVFDDERGVYITSHSHKRSNRNFDDWEDDIDELN